MTTPTQLATASRAAARSIIEAAAVESGFALVALTLRNATHAARDVRRIACALMRDAGLDLDAAAVVVERSLPKMREDADFGDDLIAVDGSLARRIRVAVKWGDLRARIAAAAKADADHAAAAYRAGLEAAAAAKAGPRAGTLADQVMRLTDGVMTSTQIAGRVDCDPEYVRKVWQRHEHSQPRAAGEAKPRPDGLLTAAEMDEARRLHRIGWSYSGIARRLGKPPAIVAALLGISLHNVPDRTPLRAVRTVVYGRG